MQGRAIPPTSDAFLARNLSLIESANQGREHMAVLWMIVVVGTIEVGHHGDIVGTVLAIQKFAIFKTANL